MPFNKCFSFDDVFLVLSERLIIFKILINCSISEFKIIKWFRIKIHDLAVYLPTSESPYRSLAVKERKVRTP